MITKKLFLVETKMPSSSGFKECYVVADDTNEAYLTVREYLDKEDYGFSGDRELVSVKFIADDYKYSSRTKLLISKDYK